MASEISCPVQSLFYWLQSFLLWSYFLCISENVHEKQRRRIGIFGENPRFCNMSSKTFSTFVVPPKLMKRATLQSLKGLFANISHGRSSNIAKRGPSSSLGLNELDSSDMSVQFLEMCLPTMQPLTVSLDLFKSSKTLARGWKFKILGCNFNVQSRIFLPSKPKWKHLWAQDTKAETF